MVSHGCHSSVGPGQVAPPGFTGALKAPEVKHSDNQLAEAPCESESYLACVRDRVASISVPGLLDRPIKPQSGTEASALKAMVAAALGTRSHGGASGIGNSLLRGSAMGLALITGATSYAWASGMATSHQFNVSESGSAGLTIPIQVPRGVGGLEPQLSLNYQSSSGNGLLGVGWFLSGISAITRCPKTLDLDGERGAVRFTSGDRYCLEGQRLVLVGPSTDPSKYGTADTEYRTVPESFSRITAIGNYNGQPGVPLSFKVETKSGLVMEFGLDAQARVMTRIDAAQGINTINRWMLQRVSDRLPTRNSVEYFYCAGEVTNDGGMCDTSKWAGSQVPHYVRYTNRGTAINGTLGLVFAYEARPDRHLQYHAGSGTVQAQRLKWIDTYTGFSSPTSSGSRARRMKFTYQALVDGLGAATRATSTSRLIRVQEFDGPLAMALPPFDLTYAHDAVLGQNVAQSPTSTPPALPLPPGCGGPMAAKNESLGELLCP